MSAGRLEQPERSSVDHGVAAAAASRAVAWRRMVAVGVSSACSMSVSRSQATAGTDDRVEADAIVVLGAAQYDGEPSPVLAADSTMREKLWREGVAPIVVTTGSNLPGDRFTEGFAATSTCASPVFPMRISS